jgi:hypothetical protein
MLKVAPLSGSSCSFTRLFWISKFMTYLKDFFLELCLHNYNLLMVEIKMKDSALPLLCILSQCVSHSGATFSGIITLVWPSDRLPFRLGKLQLKSFKVKLTKPFKVTIFGLDFAFGSNLLSVERACAYTSRRLTMRSKPQKDHRRSKGWQPHEHHCIWPSWL